MVCLVREAAAGLLAVPSSVPLSVQCLPSSPVLPHPVPSPRSYEAVVRASTHARHESPPPLVVVGAGGLAGVASWAAVYPIDTVKTAQQTAPPPRPPPRRPGAPAVSPLPPPLGFSATLRAIHAAGGVRALYAGMAPTLLRAFPTNAAVFLLYEQAIAVMGGP